MACSNSGGYWGAECKMAGWDMVIFEGKSEKPVYLYVNDDLAELRDAAHLWGKSVWQTEEMLKKSLQDPLTRVSSIGKAGKNGVLYASVVNDLHRAAGRSGVGNIKNPKAFMKAIAEKKKILAENAVTGQGLPAYGTQVLMNVINEMGALPTHNRAGFTAKDDSLPKRLLTEMMPKYYAIRGWDSEGRPTADTKERLGL